MQLNPLIDFYKFKVLNFYIRENKFFLILISLWNHLTIANRIIETNKKNNPNLMKFLNLY